MIKVFINKTKKFASLLPSFMLVLALLLSVVQSTFAWVSLAKQVGLNGPSFSSEVIRGASIFSYEIYKRDGQTQGAQIVSSSSNPQAVSMTEYDTVFTDRNVDTPVILRVVLDPLPDNTTDIVVSVKCSTTTWKDSNGLLAPYLSNIGKFRCGYDKTGALDNEDNPDTVYMGARTLLENVTPISFAYVSGTTNTKKDTDITLTFPVTNMVELNGKLTVYIEISYNSALVESYLDQHGINVDSPDSSLDDRIMFDNDVEPFFFSFDIASGGNS